MSFHTPETFVGPPAPEPSLLDRIIGGVRSFVEGVKLTAATVGAVTGIIRPPTPTIPQVAFQPTPVSAPTPVRAPFLGQLGQVGLPLLLVGGIVLAVLFLPR